MEKIINIICHPSLIVLYFKDQIYKILLFILPFFVIVASLLALYDFNTKYYDYEYVNSISDMVKSYDEEIDLVIKDNKLEGSTYTIKNDNVCLFFMKDAVASTDYSITLIFKEDRVVYYYQAYLKYEITYEKIGVDNLTFADIQANSFGAKLKLNTIIDKTLDLANRLVVTYIYFSDLINFFFYYAASVLVAIIVSMFVNPQIEFRYRFRICLYDSIIFFIVIIFALMFNLSWLRYVAMAMPAIYSIVSFKRIVRVR